MNKGTILTTEPLNDWKPDDVRNWLQEHAEQHDLAVAMSAVWNKAGWLHHELNDDSPTVTKEYYRKWRILEEELFFKIVTILENETGNKIDLNKTGWTNAIALFMERNGFCNGSGWWIKKEE